MQTPSSNIRINCSVSRNHNYMHARFLNTRGRVWNNVFLDCHCYEKDRSLARQGGKLQVVEIGPAAWDVRYEKLEVRVKQESPKIFLVHFSTSNISLPTSHTTGYGSRSLYVAPPISPTSPVIRFIKQGDRLSSCLPQVEESLFFLPLTSCFLYGTG